jgi:hypothetical protein
MVITLSGGDERLDDWNFENTQELDEQQVTPRI